MQTINTFFNLQNGSQDWISRVTQSREFAQFKQSVAQEIKGFPLPPAFYEKMVQELPNSLNIEIKDILVWAWRKRGEIIQYRDKGKYPPGETHLVPLLEHTVVSKHSPTIQAVIDYVDLPEIKLPEIKFDIVLKLQMKGAILSIQDRKIMEILVGSCTGSGSIQFAGLVVVEKKTAPYTLPATINLGEGITI
jgi:hypothetical protein